MVFPAILCAPTEVRGQGHAIAFCVPKSAAKHHKERYHLNLTVGVSHSLQQCIQAESYPYNTQIQSCFSTHSVF